MKKRCGGLWAALPAFVLAWGCTDAVPTSTDGTHVPIDATTVEVRLPFSEFATDFQAFSGFGSAAELVPLIAAREWGGDLDVYSLLRFGGLPQEIQVVPPGETATQPDDEYVVVGGEVTLRLARDQDLVGDGPFEIEVASIQETWHPITASWELAVDTLGNEVPWGEPGVGLAEVVGVGVWIPMDETPDDDELDEGAPEPNTVTVSVDSTTANRWVDTDRLDRGVRVGVTTPGAMVELEQVRFHAHVRPSINPDTTLVITAPGTPASTVIYGPEGELSPEAFQVGGAPAHRATFRMTLPEAVDVGPELCEVVQCPVELRPERFIYAGLELYTRESSPVGLRPVEGRIVELRPVLAPDRLPRSPLASPIACPSSECAMIMDATVVPSDAFFSDVGSRVDLPMTRHIRDLAAERDAEAPRVPASVAIVGGRHPNTGSEIRAIDRLTFHGPGTELEPTLRLILTLSDELGLP